MHQVIWWGLLDAVRPLKRASPPNKAGHPEPGAVSSCRPVADRLRPQSQVTEAAAARRMGRDSCRNPPTLLIIRPQLWRLTAPILSADKEQSAPISADNTLFVFALHGQQHSSRADSSAGAGRTSPLGNRRRSGRTGSSRGTVATPLYVQRLSHLPTAGGRPAGNK